MKKIVFFFISIFIFLAFGCNKSNRNYISFKVSAKLVEDSIKKMNILMDKIQPQKNEMINYFTDENGILFINSQNLGELDGINLDTVRSLKNLTSREKTEFIYLITFFNNNFISSAFKDKPSNCYLYEYRAIDDKSFNLNRDIYLNEKDKNFETLLIDKEILDKKGSLYLIGVN